MIRMMYSANECRRLLLLGLLNVKRRRRAGAASGADGPRLSRGVRLGAVGRLGVVELAGGLVVAVVAGAGDDLVDGRSGGAVAGPPALSLRRRHSDCELSLLMRKRVE